MKVTLLGREFDVFHEPADFWGWVAEGRYNHEMKLIDAHVRPEHTFIDIGAWVGSHTLAASTRARRLIAVEPDPVAFEILNHNVAKLATVYELAIADRAGVARMGSSALGWSTTRLNPAGTASIEAATEFFVATTITLRQLADAWADAQDPLFIKLDVEGAEELILRDEEFFQERKPAVLLETHPFWWQGDPAETWARIARLGFEPTGASNLYIRK